MHTQESMDACFAIIPKYYKDSTCLYDRGHLNFAKHDLA